MTPETKKPFTKKLAHKFNVELCRITADMLYIFGDNTEREGRGGQAIIRSETNSIGIATKISPAEYMNDVHLAMNKAIIDNDIANVLRYREEKGFNTIVFPKSGLGTGLAQLHIRAPRTFLYLCERLLDEFDYNNLEGLKSE